MLTVKVIMCHGGGVKGYLYPDNGKTIVWTIINGILWMSVCMVGPWQSSRYLMAKDEHTVIRSSIFSAFGIFMLQLLTFIAAVSVNAYHPTLESSSHVLIWASMNILPTVIGVIMLTGVLAAGISSGTTFLSLIGSSVANDIFDGKGNSIRNGHIAMFITAIIVMLLGMFNPPQIFWIMYMGGAIIASSWMPVALAGVLSKRVTKDGAFWGMLVGFMICFIMKLIGSLAKITYPVYLDPTFVGIVANIIMMTIVSSMTSVSLGEKEAREKMLIVPETEKNPKEVKKTERYLIASIGLGVIVSLVLVFLWALPVMNAR